MDRVQIERMITNLLSNAHQVHAGEGQRRRRLRVLRRRVEIVVEDTGRGIPTEYLPHIFDRFYRVPGSGTAPGPEQGLGLGLSFVAWIVRAHKRQDRSGQHAGQRDAIHDYAAGRGRGERGSGRGGGARVSSGG